MAGWLESLFGNLPPQPARPASRGSMMGLGGYQNMPESQNIEDRRTGATTSASSQAPAYNLNSQILQNSPPGSEVYDVDQWQWLQKHMPDDLPTTPLQDPDATPDPSITARIRNPQEHVGGHVAMGGEYGDLPTPNQSAPPPPPPPDPRRGPQIIGPLSGNWWTGP